MLAVIKLRLLGLKEDYKIMLVMAVLALGMVYAFSAQNSGAYERLVYVADLDRTNLSETLIRDLDNQNGYRVSLIDEAEGRQSIENNSGLALLVVSDGFADSLIQGKVELGFISAKNDVDTMTLKNTIKAVLSGIQSNTVFALDTAQAVQTLKPDVDETLLSQGIYQTLEERENLQNPYSIKESSLAGRWTKESTTLHNFFGFALLFSAYSIVFGIGEILNDKANHTWNRLLQSPVSTGQILFGNLVTTLFVGFIQMALIFLGGQVLFGIDLSGKLPLILVTCFGFIFSLTGLGLFLASVLKNHGQLSAITPILLTSFAMLGGCMWPLEIVSSKILLGLSTITPHRWALEAMENVMFKGHGVSALYGPVGLLLAMGLIYIAAGGWLINRQHTA